MNNMIELIKEIDNLEKIDFEFQKNIAEIALKEFYNQNSVEESGKLEFWRKLNGPGGGSYVSSEQELKLHETCWLVDVFPDMFTFC